MMQGGRLQTGWRPLLVVLLLGLISGCGGTSPARNGPGAALQPTVGLGDVPIPPGFTQVESETLLIEFGGFKGGWAVYTGDTTPSEVVTFYQDTMPVEGWKPVARFVAKESVLVYTKEGRACVISVARTASGPTRVEVRAGLAELTPKPPQKKP